MAGEGPVGKNLRNVGDISGKGKDVRDTDVLGAKAEKTTPAQKASNEGKQHYNKGGTAGNHWGGRASGA
jgi:hypothetical protein